MKVQSIQFLEDDEAIISVREWSFLFPFMRHVERKYRGSGTVWHDCETGARPGVSAELVLCNRWTVAGWKRDDTENHVKLCSEQKRTEIAGTK